MCTSAIQPELIYQTYPSLSLPPLKEVWCPLPAWHILNIYLKWCCPLPSPQDAEISAFELCNILKKIMAKRKYLLPSSLQWPATGCLHPRKAEHLPTQLIDSWKMHL